MSQDFRLTVHRDGQAIVVTIGGQVGPLEAVELRHVLRDLIDGQGNLSVAVDLSAAETLGGEALNAIAGADHALRRLGQCLEVRGNCATAGLAPGMLTG